MPRYIDANALQKRLQDFSDWCRDGRKQGVDFVLDCILPDIPTADVQEVKHGHWVWEENGMDYGIGCWLCSECLRKPESNWESTQKTNPNRWNGSKYCPNCGAKMDEEDK